MSEARKKLVELLKSKYGATQIEAEKRANELADEIIGAEKVRLRAEFKKESGSGLKAKIKRLAGLK